MLVTISASSALTTLTVVLLLRLTYNKYGHRISHIPGPSLASLSNLWRALLVWRGAAHLEHIKLHRQYGPLVRLGPNCVSVADPEALKVIYALNAGYVKSDFYPVQQTVTKDGDFLQGMFNTTDERYHAKLRRAVSNAYAMSTLVQFEPLVDSTTLAFLEQLKSRYADRSGEAGVCDFGAWLQLYAFDVIGELTFSQRLGFIDHGLDMDNIIANAEKLLKYFAVVGQMPILDRLWLKNPVRLWLSRYGVVNASAPVVVFAQQRMSSRVHGGLHGDPKTASRSDRRDFLSRFMEAGRKDPDFMNQKRVLSLTVANMFAGSDTTAISLRSIFYHLLKSPQTLSRLLEELASAESEGVFEDDRLVRWDESQKLPYLSAVIKEGLRVHPAAGLPLERIVPKGGIELCGEYIPAGAVVGCSAWTIHRCERVFGTDAETFQPERWLEASENKLVEMNASFFTFGGGARTCVGKNISYLEMYKLVPAILRTFKIDLAHPEKDWSIGNYWFVKQNGFYVRLSTKRDQVRIGTIVQGA